MSPISNTYMALGLNPFDIRAWVRTDVLREIHAERQVLIPLISGLGFEPLSSQHVAIGEVLIPLISGLGFEQRILPMGRKW